MSYLNLRLNLTLLAFCSLLPFASAQTPMPVPSPVIASPDSKWSLKELWSKKFGMNDQIMNSHIFLDSENQLQRVDINLSRFFAWNDQIAQILSYDSKGVKKEPEPLKAGDFAYECPDGNRLIFGKSGEQWEDSTGKLIHQFSKPIPGYWPDSPATSPDDSMVLTKKLEGDEGDMDADFFLFSADGELIKGFDHGTNQIWFSPDSKWISADYKNPATPKLPGEFRLYDRNGNLIFSFAMDSRARVNNCFFSEDGSRIFLVVSRPFYFYELDLKGKVISKTLLPRYAWLGSTVFLKPDLFLATGGSGIWKVQLNPEGPQFENIQKIPLPKKIEKIGKNFAVIYGVGHEAPPYPATDRGLEVIDSDGRVLAVAKPDPSLNALRVEGDYIAIWNTNFWRLFKLTE